jgi:PAS domain S-box-containing protein
VRARLSARGIVIAYTVVAASWIAFSDRAMNTFVSSDALADFALLKGLGFVAVTGLLLAWLLSRYSAERAARADELEVQVVERQRAEAHLERLNRVLRSLSLANQALVHTTDEAVLLRAFATVIVEQGAFMGAWVGCREDDAEATIRPVAWAGRVEGYLEAIALSWRDPDRGSLGPAGTSIRERRTVLVRDVERNETLAWREEMLARGFRSMVALPIIVDDSVFGSLVIYAGDPDSFGNDEMALLEELASNLAYGVGTLRTRAAAARGEAERRRLAVAIEQSAEAVVITDTAAEILYVNPAFEQVSGYTRDEVVGQNPRILKSGVQAPAFYAAMWASLASGQSFVGDLTNRHKDGSLFQEEAVISPIRDENGTITSYVAVKRDVTRERASEAARERVSRERALIAGTLARLQVLPTPEATAEAICRQVASQAGVASAGLSYFTVDGPAMPLALVRADGAIVSLYRLQRQKSQTNRERAEQGPWVERWARRPSHPYYGMFRELGVKAIAYAPVRYGGQLIGLMTVTSSHPDAVAQLTESLPALLEFSGFAGALVGPAIADLTEINRVRDRIAATIRTGAFRPVFQPVVDLATGAHVGYEALTRFTDGIAPNLVFGDARAAGLEADLELATLAPAIAEARRLPPGGWLSLNVSPNLVTSDPRLADVIRLADRPLVLEVTEHVPVDDYAALRAAIERLPANVRVAVDDAGSGVANFNHILELRPAFLKLDIGLVRGIDSDLSRQALMVGLLHFAHDSASQTIAEGVETDAELAALRGLGVPFAQGYLLGRPAAVESWAGAAP